MIVTLDYDAIEEFKDQWPCNGFPELYSITFEYDSRGNLVDISAKDINEEFIDSSEFDGQALLALSHDAQIVGPFYCAQPCWMI